MWWIRLFFVEEIFINMVSSGILFVLGLSVCRKYFPFEVSAIPWAYPLSAHGHGSVRPNLMKVHAIFLPSSVAPFTPWVRQPWVEGPIGWRFKVLGMTIQSSDDDSKFWGWRIKGLWVDGFNADAVNRTLPWQVVQKQLWRMTRVILWLGFSSDWRVASSSVHFLYIYHTPPFSFLHFQLKHTVRALPSSLSESDLFSSCICHRHNSFVHSQIWWVFSFHKSLLLANILFIFLDFIHTRHHF